jgi:hypothetical protein
MAVHTYAIRQWQTRGEPTNFPGTSLPGVQAELPSLPPLRQ